MANFFNYSLPIDGPVQRKAATSKPRARGAARQTTPATKAGSSEARPRKKKSPGDREFAILRVVAQHGPAPDACLTSLEILRALHARGALPNAINPNLVRPRLTELRERGLVENPAAPGEFDDEGAPRPLLKQVGVDRPAAVWRATALGVEALQQAGIREKV